MMPEIIRFDGMWWLLLLLGPLLLIQRVLHREIQGVFLLLTRRPDMSMMLFSILFFPGVLLHEISHFTAALLLGVRTGRISLIPVLQPGGRLQLGYVETSSSDFIRDALIGFAPLLTGGLFISFAGMRMGLPQAWSGLTDPQAVFSALAKLTDNPDFWVWFYLAFTVSSTMMPSASDRRAWLPLSLAFLILLVISLVVGAGPWMAENLAKPLNNALRSTAAVFGIAVMLHGILLLPTFFLRKMLTRITGLEIA